MLQLPSILKEAMLSNGGIEGSRTVIVDASTAGDLPQVKWDGMSSLNNFQYSESGITIWRAYNVGEGKIIRDMPIPGDDINQ